MDAPSFYNIVESESKTLIAVNNKKIVYSLNNNLKESDLGILSLDDFLYLFLDVPSKDISVQQFNEHQAVVSIGKLEHSKQECELLYKLLTKSGIATSNRLISSIIGYKFHPSEQELKILNEELYPEQAFKKQFEQHDKLEKPHASITVKKRKENIFSTRTAIAAIVIAAIVIIGVEHDAFAAFVCVRVVEISYSSMDFETAQECNDTVLNKYPDDSEALKWDKVIKDAKEHLPIQYRTPASNKELNDRADSLLEKNNPRAAVVLYNVVYVKDNNSGRALLGIGNALVQIDNLEVEKIYYKDELNLNLSNVDKFDVAWEYYSRIEKLYQFSPPNNGIPEAITGKGNILFIRNNFDESMQMYDHAKTLCEKEEKEMKQPESKETCVLNALKGEGFVHLRKLEYAQAIDTFNAVLTKKTDDTGAQTGLFYLYLSKGDTEKSRTIMQKILKSNPDSVGNIVKDSILLADKGDTDVALQLYDDILLKIMPDDPTLLNGKGTVLLKIDKNEAIKFYEANISKYSENINLRLGYANALYEIANYERAFIEYQKVLNLDPDNEIALIGLERSGKNI